MKSPIILEDALKRIAEGTVDAQYPYRDRPRDVLMAFAREALRRYEESGVVRRAVDAYQGLDQE